MSRWVGVVYGDEQRKYVQGDFRVLVESIEGASRFGSRDEAIKAAQEAMEEVRQA